MSGLYAFIIVIFGTLFKSKKIVRKIKETESTFKRYREVPFMEALQQWDKNNKKLKCKIGKDIFEFDTNTDLRKDFKVNAELILSGIWFVEK